MLYENPKEICINITRRCNAFCRMCWRVHARQAETTLEYPWEVVYSWKSVLEQADLIQWYGDGEFFAYTGISELLAFMNDLSNVQHSFSTNGKKLRRFARQLAPINIHELILSVDGATVSTFENIRRGIEFSAVVDGVQALRMERVRLKLPPVPFRINFVSMSLNIHELPDLVRLACYLGVQTVTVVPLVIYPHSPEMEEWKIDPVKELEYCREAVEVATRLRVAIKHTHIAEVSFVPEEMIEAVIPGVQSPSFEPFCHLPWYRMMIGTHGEVHVCCHNLAECGNVFEQSPESIWQGEVYEQLRKQILADELPESCGDSCPIVSDRVDS